MAGYRRTGHAIDCSATFAVIVVAALLGTAGLDAYAVSTFFGSSGASVSIPGHHGSVVHLESATTQNAAAATHARGRAAARR